MGNQQITSIHALEIPIVKCHARAGSIQIASSISVNRCFYITCPAIPANQAMHLPGVKVVSGYQDPTPLSIMNIVDWYMNVILIAYTRCPVRVSTHNFTRNRGRATILRHRRVNTSIYDKIHVSFEQSIIWFGLNWLQPAMMMILMLIMVSRRTADDYNDVCDDEWW